MRIPLEYYEEAAKALRYEPETGKLFWKEGGRGRNPICTNAGTVNDNGYTRISVSVLGKARRLYAHQIVWFMHHKETTALLDHINNDRSDNRIENLRAATHQQNTWNCSTKGTSSKYLGVWWDKKSKKWESSIRIGGGKKKRLGVFTCEKEAALAYNKAASELRGEFANLNQI